MALYRLNDFGVAYGADSYGSCTYNSATACTTTTGSGSTSSTGSSSSSGLANTGTVVGLVVGAACLIVFVALVVRFWRRPNQARRTAAETVAQDNTRR